MFEIVTPGTWLDYDDRDWSWKIQNQLRSLESQFFEANAALNLFVNAQSIRLSFADRENWERDSQRPEIQRAVEQERGGFRSREHWDETHFEAEVSFKREKWSNGGVPREFEHNLPFIYARAFSTPSMRSTSFSVFLRRKRTYRIKLQRSMRKSRRRFRTFDVSATRLNTSKIGRAVSARARIRNRLISSQSQTVSSMLQVAECSH